MTDTAQGPRERKRRSQTRWGPSPVPDKDGGVPAEPSEQPTDGGQQAAPAPQAPGSDGKDLSRRKRTRWGPGDVKVQAAAEPGEGTGPTAVTAAPHDGVASLAGPPLPLDQLQQPPNREGAGAAPREAEAAQLAEAYHAFKQEVGSAVQGAKQPGSRPAGEDGASAEDVCNLYVGNVSATVTEEGLSALFDSVVRKSLQECRLVPDPSAPYRHRGFALVRIADEDAARRALQLLHDYPLGGQNLVVKPHRSVQLSAQDQGAAAAAAAHPAGAWGAPPTSSAAAPVGYGDYYQPGGAYAGGGGYDSYPYSYHGAYPPVGDFGGGATGANATPVGPGAGYGGAGGPAAAPAPATPPVPPSDRPPGTEDDPEYHYAYPSPDRPASVALLASLFQESGVGPDPAVAAAVAIEGLAHLTAAVKAEVARREEEGLLPPGVEAAGDFAAGQHPAQLFGAPPQPAQPSAGAAGYEAWGSDPRYGYWDGTAYFAYAAQEGVAEAAGQQGAKPNLEPPRIKPRVPRSRQRKAAQAAAAAAAPQAEPIAVPLPADWEEKQKAKKVEEVAAKMAAAAAAKAEAGTGAVEGEKAQAAAGAAGPALGVGKLAPGMARPTPARPASPRRLSPLRFSRSPSPRRPLGRGGPPRGRSPSRSPPPHLRYPSRSRSPNSRSLPRYHSRSPSPHFRGPPFGGRGRGRGPHGRGGYPAPFRGRSPAPGSPAGRGRRFDSRSPPPRRFSPSPRRFGSHSPPPRRSPSLPYDDYRGCPPPRGPPRSRSPLPRQHYSSRSRSPASRQRYGSPEGGRYASRSPPPRSPPSSPEEGELEEGEIELDPREARRLEQQQRRQPSPPPRHGYGRPPPPPFGGRGGRGGRGGPPLRDGGGYDYAGEFDFVSGQSVVMPAMPLMSMMGGGMMLPLGAVVGGGVMMMPGAAGRGGLGGRGGAPGRGR